MIVLDTSALMAIHGYEPERQAFRTAVTRAAGGILPASVYLEFVLATKRRAMSRAWLDRVLSMRIMRIEPITAPVTLIAADAAERFGRGSRHPARLNFGDCLSYAVAKHLGAPLLYKGHDFTHTDIESALPA